MLAGDALRPSAIGVANDYFDRDLDAASKPWKPHRCGPRACAYRRSSCALGSLPRQPRWRRRSARAVSCWRCSGMSCGLAYDARLKRTLLSAVPFMVAIPTLPIWVWLTLGVWQPGALVAAAAWRSARSGAAPCEHACRTSTLMPRTASPASRTGSAPRRSMLLAWIVVRERARAQRRARRRSSATICDSTRRPS